ncbi:unnamed protein product [Clonostachys rosea]|uniref:Major facilitator superfamily (MFS) profile domain-containing protein n=1 Tax=Bionectria ochroleuca TaxID=29856 RepID=A0ABY6U2C0_BIOOC|nr:unnamed protein product [Clonostachys rosea]
MANSLGSQPSTLGVKIHNVFRGTYFQAVLLGLISFTQPGIWSAMNSLGAGGQAEPYAVNAANVITFVIMVVLAPFASIVGNLIGMKWIVVFGCIGYVFYSASLYVNSVYGTQWFLLLGAALCGLSATALWPGEAAIAVGYPEVRKRGRCVAIWMAIGKLGSIIAASIQLSLNSDKDKTGAISPKTYIVLIAIQCLGLPLALLISPPDKLIREDGRKPTFANQDRTFKNQFIGFLQQFKRKEIILFIPAYITAQWGITYQGNYMAAYFTVRARTLAGLITALVGVAVNLIGGWWLDTRRLRRSTQARSFWYATLALYTLVWIWNIVIQERWAKNSPGEIDWSGSKWNQGVAIFTLYRVAYEAIGMWLYWALGTHDYDMDTVSLSVAILRGGEALGSAVGYGIGSIRSATLMTNLIVSVVLFYVGAPFTTWAAHLIKDRIPGEESDSIDDEIRESSSSEVEQQTHVVSTKN